MNRHRGLVHRTVLILKFIFQTFCRKNKRGLRKASGSKDAASVCFAVLSCYRNGMHFEAQLVPRTLLALALFLTVNCGLAFLPAQPAGTLDRAEVALTERVIAEGKPSSWWLARTYITGERVPDVVVCGSSQIGGLQAADANTTGKTIDFVANHHCPTLEKALQGRLGRRPYVFLSALPGAMISDHFAIARALYKNAAPPVVVVTVSPRDFIDNTLPCAGSTEPYRFFSRYSDMQPFTNLAFNDSWSRFCYAVSNELPVRKLLGPFDTTLALLSKEAADVKPQPTQDVSQVKAADASEQLKFVMGGYDGNLKPGLAIVEPNMPRIFVDNTGDYKKRYKNTHPAAYDVQMKFFDSYLSFLNGCGVQVLVVGMPLTETNRNILPAAFWQSFRDKIASTCTAHGAEYLDLSAAPDFNQADFCDTVHLNAWGGAKLADHIASAIAASDRLKVAVIKDGLKTAQRKNGAM